MTQPITPVSLCKYKIFFQYRNIFFKEIPEESDEYPDYSSGGIPPSKISNSNLSKIAEAAGRKMKKLKTNWSIKKSDITRSLSRIKKTSRPALDLGPAPDGQ